MKINIDINIDIYKYINNFWRFIIDNKWITLITFIYFILTTAWLLSLHYSFMTAGYDLGQYVQMFWNTINGGDIMSSDLRVRPGNPTGFYFWEHFSPILFLFVPIFYIYPSAWTLLIMKSFFIALSIPMLWIIVKKYLDKAFSFIVMSSYILNPYLFKALSTNFQEQFILPLLLFAAFYFYLEGRYKLFAFLTLLGLTVNEYSASLAAVSLFGLALSAYISLGNMSFGKELFTGIWKKLKNKKVLVPLMLSIIASIYFVIVILMLKKYADTGIVDTGIFASYADVNTIEGERLNVAEYVKIIVTNPTIVISAIADKIGDKVLNLNLFLLPTLYMSLLSPISAFPLALYAGFGWLTQKPAFYAFQQHHPLYILPYIYIGFVFAIKNIILHKEMIRETVARLPWRLFIIIPILLFAIQVSAYIDQGFYPIIDDHTKMLHDIIQYVPEDSSVMVQNNLFPYFATRKNAYIRSADTTYYQFLEVKGMVDPEYILVDERHDKSFNNIKSFIQNLLKSGEYYGIWVYADGIYLLKKDYHGEMNKLPENYTYTYVYGPSDIKISEGDKGFDYISHRYGFSGNTFWQGPHIWFPPGHYKVTWELRRDKTFESDDRLIRLEVTNNKAKELFAFKDVKYPDVGKSWTKISAEFTIDALKTDMEFRGMYPSPKENIYLRRITVVELPPIENETNSDIRNNVTNMTGNMASKT